MTTEDEILKVAREAATSLLGRRDIGQAYVMQGPSFLALKAAEAGARALAAHLAAGGENIDDPTDKMVDAALKVDWANEDERAVAINVWHAMCAARGAAPPAKAEVKVKALVWDGSVIAETPFGAYTVGEDADGGWTWAFVKYPYADPSDPLPSESAAKAAAQADYDARIRSALAEDAVAATRGLIEASNPDHPLAGVTDEMWSEMVRRSNLDAATPAPASDDLADRLDAPTPFYGWKDPENYTPVMIPPGPLRTEASARIRSDATTIASLRAEVADYNDERSRDLSVALARAEAAKAERDALKAEVARALELAAYRPGECPIVPVNIQRAIDGLRAALAPTPAKEG